jgi:dephospho-CoA kinase
MIKVGITGGIGTGKSLICQIFSMLGVPVYYADLAAKKLTASDPEIRKELILLMGRDIYTGNLINRPEMAQRIFKNPELLKKVEKIIHPRVFEHFKEWCSSYSNQPYIIQESALLFESDAYLIFDRFVTVSAPLELRISRVIKRKGMKMETVRSIIRNQLPEEEKIKRAHYVLINDEKMLLLPQILNLHQILTNIK